MRQHQIRCSRPHCSCPDGACPEVQKKERVVVYPDKPMPSICTGVPQTCTEHRIGFLYMFEGHPCVGGIPCISSALVRILRAFCAYPGTIRWKIVFLYPTGRYIRGSKTCQGPLPVKSDEEGQKNALPRKMITINQNRRLQ